MTQSQALMAGSFSVRRQRPATPQSSKTSLRHAEIGQRPGSLKGDEAVSRAGETMATLPRFLSGMVSPKAVRDEIVVIGLLNFPGMLPKTSGESLVKRMGCPDPRPKRESRDLREEKGFPSQKTASRKADAGRTAEVERGRGNRRKYRNVLPWRKNFSSQRGLR